MRRVGLIAVFVAMLGMQLMLIAHAAAAGEHAKLPENASSKVSRDDLATAVKQKGEIRVIVGLQTALELAGAAPKASDDVKELDIKDRQSRLLKRLARHALRDIKQLRHHPFVALTVDAAGLAALLADPEVTTVAEDRPVYPVLNDTPGITRADKAWADGYAGAGQTVAIIDTGVDKSHPFFAGKVVAEACFSNPRPGNLSYCPGGAASVTGTGTGVPCSDSDLGCWHGTHVAGIAAGRYGVLSSTTGGIANAANVVAIQVFQRTCDTSGCRITAYDSDILLALDYVYSLRTTFNIAAVNLSLGGDLYTAACDSSLPGYVSVVSNLRSANIATVVAAGNNGNASAISAPGCLSSVISVGSTTKSNTISSFSNSASFLSLLAPGTGITSSVPGGGFASASGTSMATPHVTGAWAILKSAKPSATVDEVLSALQSKGLPITDVRNGVTKSLIQIGNGGAQLGALGVMLGTNSIPTVTLASPVNNALIAAAGPVNLVAAAADSDGVITRVEFYRNGALIATVTSPSSGAANSGTWTYSDTGLAIGAYTYTAKVYDNATPAAVVSSASALVTVTTSPVNVAAQANGGTATASTVYAGSAGNFPPSAVINGDRKGQNWGSSAASDSGWNDATPNAFPDSLQVSFSGVQTITEVDVFSVQDNYKTPVEPTTGMTFTLYGLVDFDVQYHSGGTWLAVPGGSISGNNLVWRRVTFPPLSADAIRVVVNSALNTWSRIAEVEAWTQAFAINAPPTVSLTSPTNNAMLKAPAAVNLTATALDPDGSVSKVEFYRDGSLIATVSTPIAGAYSYTDSNVGVGAYAYTAKVYDNAMPAGTSTSAAALVSVTAADASSVNVAAQARGAIATASSSYVGTAGAFPPSAAINGDRKGQKWGGSGAAESGWNDGTPSAFPDWLQVNFSGPQNIGEIDVFSVQDNYASPVDPTPSLTFSQYGVVDFRVQYWNGTEWVDVPGGNITGNKLVWRRITFPAITTNAIRVMVNSALNTWSRIAEVEAWTVAAVTSQLPRVNVAAQTSGGVATASSFYNTAYAPSGANNGDRKGQNWGIAGSANSGWNDASPGTFPDWLQITFNSTYSISEVSVFSVQDSYKSPIDPTSTMTFTLYGLVDFQVQYWTGTAWANIPGGDITGNNLVWRRLTFPVISTSAIRILVNSALNTWSRIAEVEAWTAN